MNKTLRNTLIFIGILVALFVVYMVFFQKETTPQTTSSLSSSSRPTATTPLNASSVNTGSTLLSLLGRISNLTLNDDIFANPQFRRLEDSTITLPAAQTQGRRNPFVPAGLSAPLSQTESVTDVSSPLLPAEQLQQ